MIGNALDNYSSEIPSLQNAVDIFKGEWSSAVPGSLTSGPAPLFTDPRVTYWIEKTHAFFNVRDSQHQINALELGPLEGAHSYMFSNAGWKVTSVESNSRAFLKTLIIYNEFRLNAKVLFGDFIPYLRDPSTPVFDFLSASGVLYHMKNPLEALDLICAKSTSFGLWTHFVTDEYINSWPGRWHETECHSLNKLCTGFKQFYGNGLESHAFCGGGQDFAVWLRKEDILTSISGQGFSIDIDSIDLNHPNGPCLTLFACKNQ